MKELIPYIVGIVVLSVAFVLMVRAGLFLRFSGYWGETMVEMKKCNWPTWDELVGLTTVVTVAVAIIGGFTVGVDFLISFVISKII